MAGKEHIPVLLEEVIAHWQPIKDFDSLLDCTLGLGGHARAFLEGGGPHSTVVGLEADLEALEKAQAALEACRNRVTAIHANFGRLQEVLEARGIEGPSFTHVLFDLGVGTHQLADPRRGFSFQLEGPLTMKYGPADWLPPARVEGLNVLERRLGRYPDVSDILTGLKEEQLGEIIRTYGEERHSQRVAKGLRAAGGAGVTAAQLARIIAEALPSQYERGRIHPATRTFQALRLAVNRELEVLEAALPQAVAVLKPGGVLAVISFHSLEDRIVKRFFQREARDCLCPPEQVICICGHTAQLTIVTKKPVTAGTVERAKNPRARSAKLRAARKKE